MTDFITLRAALAAGPTVAQSATVAELMEQAQVFASAWSIVNGRFDFGDALEEAQQAKKELRSMLADTIAALLAELDDARRDAERLRAALQLVIDADADDTLGIEFGLLEAVKSAMKQHEKT